MCRIVQGQGHQAIQEVWKIFVAAVVVVVVVVVLSYLQTIYKP